MASRWSISKDSLLSVLRESLRLESERVRAALGREWERAPATPEEFIESAEFLGNSLNNEYWPVVKQDVLDFYVSGKHEACFCEAIGSGKSYKSSIVAAYEAHRLLCLRNPAKTLGLSSDSKLTILNMGPRAMQARRVVYSKIRGRIDACPWFKFFFPYDKKITSELRFPKNIYIVPGNSKETFPLGYDLVVAILDEADFYVDNEDRPVADEIHQAMRMRMESRVGNKWPWKIIDLSSPLYEEGFIERKMAEADAPNSDVFGRRRPIWEAKPWQYPGQRIKWTHLGVDYMVPEGLLAEAVKNPNRFLRDRCAIAITSLTPYFPDHAAIDAGIDAGLRFQQNGTFPDDLNPMPGCVYFVHIDLAKSRDACGFALGHNEKRGGVIDFAWRIRPEGGREVNFAAVRQAVLELRRRGFVLGKVSYDGWQSVDSIQQLTAKGIECEELSVDRTLEPYDTLLEAVNERRAYYPATPLPDLPQGILIKELRGLELKKGSKVDHPPRGSKDLADAVAGVFYHLRGTEVYVPQTSLIKRTGLAGRRGAPTQRPGAAGPQHGMRGGYLGGMGQGYGRSRY